MCCKEMTTIGNRVTTNLVVENVVSIQQIITEEWHNQILKNVAAKLMNPIQSPDNFMFKLQRLYIIQ